MECSQERGWRHHLGGGDVRNQRDGQLGGILTLDPNNNLRLYYGTDRVLRTLDGCATAWTSVSRCTVWLCQRDCRGAIRLEPGIRGNDRRHLYRSDDGGNTSPWADRSSTLPFAPC